MAISLANLRKVTATAPARILAYGPPGIGKTTLGTEFPNSVFIQVEDGTPGDVEINSLLNENGKKPASFKEVMDCLSALYTEDHDLQTLVIDSVTEMERLVFQETCQRGDEHGNAKKGIEDFGYGKGYVNAQKVWKEFLEGANALRNDRNMTIFFIAHSIVSRFDDPETASYDRYSIALHKQSVGIIEREMDVILLLKQPVTIKSEESGFNQKRSRADGGGLILMNAIGKPAFTAKNRYGIPATLRFDKGHGFEVLAPYLPGFKASGEAAAAEPSKDTDAKAAA